ncbi:MAG: hypothetical protein ABIO04_09850, partial [Ferruginibacter sp.]
MILLAGSLVVFIQASVVAQLGIYEFTGSGTCPNPFTAVTIQPANAIFSNISSANVVCKSQSNRYATESWNLGGTIDPAEFIEFSVTAVSGYGLNLSSVSFNQYAEDDKNENKWFLRSSLDNFTSDLGSNYIPKDNPQFETISLPASQFNNIAGATFRIYIIKMKDNGKFWSIDDVNVNGSVIAVPSMPAVLISNSPQCSNPGVTINATGSPATGETWYWQTSASGTSTAISTSTFNTNASGTYYLRAQNNAGAWSLGGAAISVIVTPTVAVPVFTFGLNSSRCMGGGSVTYTATAINSSSLTYSLDATSTAAGNVINAVTGQVTYDLAWTGMSTITATAEGCNGPVTAIHLAATNSNVQVPIFSSGSSSTRCLGAGTIVYTTMAVNNSGITYSLDPLSLVAGNTINPTSGAVTYSALWVGQTTITAFAAGCSGPLTATHTVTIIGSVGTPVFSLGSASSRCQGIGAVTYSSTATNNSGIVYSLDPASITGGNSINSATGQVTYATGWSGTSTITSTAIGCAGPKSANHTVTVTPTVGMPVFTMGATSTRCQGSGNVNYSATTANNTSKIFSLDVNSSSNGNTINSSTGQVTYSTGWSGTTIITCTVNGCNGPVSATHTVTITPTVSIPVFLSGSNSSRCQGVATILQEATSLNTTGITYSLNAASLSGGNSINSTTGSVMYVASWSGSTFITASAAGCNGPKTAMHTVSITPTVGTPVFVLGATSARCQGSNTVTYTADANNNTIITYSLDAVSLSAGNTINSSNGAVTYFPDYTGTSVITASADGCNGPRTSNHTVTINRTVGAATFNSGPASIRCQGTGSVTYTATCPNATAYSYTLDAASIAGNNTINALTGIIAYAANWNGTTTITAIASGCSGPASGTHTVTVTPTVSIPVFYSGTSSTRCQGTATVNYAASALNSTSISYSLDAASTASGNTINTTTGDVTYVNNWTGSTTITATAVGCNGPKTSSHLVTLTATVGTPVFALGEQSVRNQGAGTVVYGATSSNNTGITYSLDPASISGGNSINPLTGTVTWTAGWFGVSVVTASANGCNGPATATHMVNANPSIVQSPLYLSTGQTLDRIDPVSTGLTVTSQTADLSLAATTNATFTLNPVLCSDLTIKAQTIAVALYLSITSGSMPANPSITAQLKYGSTNIISLSNPVYNAASGLLTWSGVLGADVIVPAGQPIDLVITIAESAVVFKISYHSISKPSRISLLPVSTFIDFTSFDVYTAPYPNGNKRISGNRNTTYYARATVTTPFGYRDITGLDIKITPPGTTVPVTCVDSTSCTRTFEYAWTTSNTTGVIYLLATA